MTRIAAPSVSAGVESPFTPSLTLRAVIEVTTLLFRESEEHEESEK
ncbi:MAG: hypothetical protein FWC50_15290 [Planctomycetaceae bacterium]|nr:hypothetical protein [Planctomycetaceae bacterium]